MSNEKLTFQAFMKENALEKAPVEYVASERFVVNGEPVPWKLRVLSNDELDAIARRNTKVVPIKASRETKKVYNNEQFTVDMTLAMVVYPDLNDEALQTSYGAIGAEDLLKKMLTPGELADLYLAANEVNDFKVGMNDKIKEAKNS